MKYLVVVSFLFSSLCFAEFDYERFNVSFVTGTASFTKKQGEQTHGTANMVRAELFHIEHEDRGLIWSVSSLSTASDTLTKTNLSNYKYKAGGVQAGGFIYFQRFFRAAGGLGLHRISETSQSDIEKNHFHFSEMGPFVELGGKYALQRFEFGMDYIYQSTKSFKQSGLYFSFGANF